jgi:hypothetical protein
MRFDRLPGVIFGPSAPRTAAPIRLDVPVFVGVAPRGPARVPVVDERWPNDATMVDPARPRVRSVAVPVDSLDAYRGRFGAVESGGYLGRSVAAFFAQGGRRCWVMRIVHRYPPGADPLARCARALCVNVEVAGAPAGSGLVLVARDEGAWGNGITAQLRVASEAAPVRWRLADSTLLSTVPQRTPVGTLLRWRASGGAWQLARVEQLTRVHAEQDEWQLALDAAPPAMADLRFELLSASLALADRDGNRESHAGLGFDPRHPRAAAAVLCRESQLVWPDPAWAMQPRRPAQAAVELLAAAPVTFAGGSDDNAAIVPDDVFDAAAPEGFWLTDPDPDLPAGEGIDALRRVDEPALLVVPDLYHPTAFAQSTEVIDERLEDAGAEFSRCLPGRTVQLPPPPAAWPGLLLDPRNAADYARIVRLQRQLAAFAQSRLSVAPLAALLDVPPLLSQQKLERWRSEFDCADAAGYGPWLSAAVERGASGRRRQAPVPPSAFAAGIIAAREIADGVPFGPAQKVAREAVAPFQRFAPQAADALHAINVNLFLPQAEGLALMGARTLSMDTHWRALAARRVLHWLVRWLQREAPWLVFEPLTSVLANEVEIWLANLLRRLWRAGALTGTREQEAFFVRVQAEPARSLEGALLVEIGLALAEPLEFIVVRLRLADDGLQLALPTALAAADRELAQEA